MGKVKKNMTKCLADSIIRRIFVSLNITNKIRTYFTRHIWRRLGLRSLSVRGVQQTFGTASFFYTHPTENNRNISKMLNRTNHANEAKDSNLDRTERAPKWVGVLGYVLLFSVPLEDYNFARNFLCWFCFCLPMAAFCFYATGAFDELIKTLKNK
jgi:hypothetical protein